MRGLVLNVVLVFIMAIGVGSVSANESKAKSIAPEQSMPMAGTNKKHLFEERDGSWKATCDEMEDKKVYCRMFHIEQFGEWKAKNFVQIGPAWTPDAVGFVIATYLGFKEGTKVTLGVDKHERHEFTAPRGNNMMTSPEVAEKILSEMENGNKIVVYFHSYSGVQQLSLADLNGYKKLLLQVKQQMARNNP